MTQRFCKISPYYNEASEELIGSWWSAYLGDSKNQRKESGMGFLMHGLLWKKVWRDRKGIITHVSWIDWMG